MTLYTPLARLGTFLFPSNSRRISAPMPAPRPADKRKRCTLPSDSPPKCRRRLSFADSEIKSSTTDAQIIAAIHALDSTVPRAYRLSQWSTLHHLLSDAGTDLPSLSSLQLSTPLLSIFARSLDTEDLQELDEAALVFEAVMAKSSETYVEPALISAVLAALIRFPHRPVLVTAMSPVLRTCIQDHAAVVVEYAAALFRAVVGELDSVDDAVCWEALVGLLGICVPQDVRERGKRLRVTEADVNVILGSFERLAKMDGSCTEGALQGLRDVLEEKMIAGMLVTENGSAVIAEAASLHPDRLGLQRTCVELLALLSSPKIFYYISDL